MNAGAGEPTLGWKEGPGSYATVVAGARAAEAVGPDRKRRCIAGVSPLLAGGAVSGGEVSGGEVPVSRLLPVAGDVPLPAFSQEQPVSAGPDLTRARLMLLSPA
jgi:hypothetical protein